MARIKTRESMDGRGRGHRGAGDGEVRSDQAQLLPCINHAGTWKPLCRAVAAVYEELFQGLLCYKGTGIRGGVNESSLPFKGLRGLRCIS